MKYARCCCYSTIMCIISLFQTMLGVDGGGFCVATPRRVYLQTGCVMTTTTVTTGRTSRTVQVSYPHFFLIIASSLGFICCCCCCVCVFFCGFINLKTK